ncbi:hypothetical protein HYDPIDRAFT_28036 [Hydnomerulius pinastri MD-312]|uniref:Uncharacterized protein n=1 Tax=Hydnomerulius pinastri MD-312 TaxID=994086 RepID=A0A0C9W2P3_9AGAM|nr:hypothetical protein HYDPIDRAFT_28036 [Hydnomerulius pinastri MD-312]
MARQVRFQPPVGGWPRTIDHGNSEATAHSGNNRAPIASSLASTLMPPVGFTMDIDMSPPPWPPRADPAVQIDVNMSPPPRSAVPTGPSHIIDLDASPPRRSTHLSHVDNLPNVPMIDPFLSPPPRRRHDLSPRSAQGIRLDVSPPTCCFNLPPIHTPHPTIDLDTSPPRCTPPHLPGAAALQPRNAPASAAQSILQIINQLTASTSTQPSGPWPLLLRAQSLAQSVAGAWNIQADHMNIHEILRLLIELHHLKERLQDASDQQNHLQDVHGMLENSSHPASSKSSGSGDSLDDPIDVDAQSSSSEETFGLTPEQLIQAESIPLSILMIPAMMTPASFAIASDTFVSTAPTMGVPIVTTLPQGIPRRIALDAMSQFPDAVYDETVDDPIDDAGYSNITGSPVGEHQNF